MSRAAINPAKAVAGRACDHSIRVAKGEPKYVGKEMESPMQLPRARSSQGRQPESAVHGIVGRRQFLVPQLHHTDDRDTPLTFKLQQGGEQRQGRRNNKRFKIVDCRFQI